MVEEKEKLEQTLKELWEILKTNNVGMTEAVVDTEGYPRSDIDVYQVRHARHQIKCLQNDHTALLRRIDEGLSVVMGPSGQENSDPNGTENPTPPTTLEPFARVGAVEAGSPAFLAGLREDDQVTKFGSVTSENFRSLSDVAQVVQHSRNTQVQVGVVRGLATHMLALTPRQWAGRGLLGCNLVPIERIER
ncbi:hypothetical protein Pcinc_019148 [Petrolisthes cinctipes]|uniref:26S proteasome non-ATPase regulatory subunit 9 n=1 Tax=Petrolisthes cinctipes TaxID=88211 RepID=A0AAE1EM72_PETCI|nr:hypothetical protein Pcinc_036837 [Petrolisthes cinctipes]KAK3876005.1 hypothetical protein Pcinc_019148 [Petrolisthes cinctipes]